MGDELVSTRSTQSERGGGDKRPASLFAYTEEFERSFPYYLAIGMTYEQYWEQDSTLVRAYRKAAKIQRDLRNQDAWLQGAYFYEALCDAAPIFRAFAKKGTKATPYRDGPFEFKTNTEEPEERKSHEEKQDEKAKSYMEMPDFVITLPVVESVVFSLNPVEAGGKTVLSVAVKEITKTVYPEDRYAGEFYSGE